MATDSVRDAMKILPTVRPASKGADEGWAVLSTLISGFVIFGGIGWMLDQWWGTRLMTPIGLVLGMALSIYAVVKQFGGPRGEGDHAQATKTEQTTNAGQLAGTSQSVTTARALSAAKAANRAKAYHRARAAHARHAADALSVHSPNDGPPPASTRRETECL
ncbi:MAG: AtpZ/AtpI family protein [Nakamurella sp.]